MKNLPLIFDSTGFSYDVDNPTKETEKLAYLLSQWLESEIDPVEANIPIWGGEELIAPAIASAQLTVDIVEGVAAAITNKEIPVADLDPIQCEFSGLSELVESLRDTLENISRSIDYPETYQPVPEGETRHGLTFYLDAIRIQLQDLAEALAMFKEAWTQDEMEDPEGGPDNVPSTLYRFEMAMADVAAASGVVLDAPGSVVSVNRQTPEEP
jgi:hypothetical protein